MLWQTGCFHSPVDFDSCSNSGVGGRTPLTKHLTVCRRKVVAAHEKKRDFSSLLLCLFFPLCSLRQLSSSSVVCRLCVLIPDAVTGRLITARLQMLSRRGIDCAAAVTNIDHGHIAKFSAALPERSSMCAY